MEQKDRVIACYNATAKEYGEQFIDELAGKSLDRLLLKRFATENQSTGLVLDLACGPGQTTQFLFEAGLTHIRGIDLSDQIIEEARRRDTQGLSFESGDMLNLDVGDGEIGAALCFYGIVHFTVEELKKALQEIHRVLRSGGQFLFSFHVGQERKDLTEFLGKEVEITFYYFEMEVVLSLLQEIGFAILEVIERHPYPDVEYPSRRAYLLVEK